MGIPNVDEMLAGMNGEQYNEWMAFSHIEPFGDWRADVRIAMLAATIVNVMTRTEDSDPVHEMKEFMPDFEAALDEMNAQQEFSKEELTWRKIDILFGAMAKANKKPNDNNSNTSSQVNR